MISAPMIILIISFIGLLVGFIGGGIASSTAKKQLNNPTDEELKSAGNKASKPWTLTGIISSIIFFIALFIVMRNFTKKDNSIQPTTS